jgi:hypothetical protein
MHLLQALWDDNVYKQILNRKEDEFIRKSIFRDKAHFT